MPNTVIDNGVISAVKLVTSESITTPTLTANNSLIYKGKELADILDGSAAGSNGPFVKLEGGNEITGNQTITGELTVTEDSESSGYPGQLYFSGIPTEMLSDAVYDLGVLNENKDLSGIRFADISTHVQTCEIWFSIGDEAYDIYWPENMLWLDSTDGNAPAIVVRTEYRVAIRKETNGSMVASIAYAVGEGQQSVDEMIRDAAQKDGDNIFTGANTFTGEVDMSTASVTPPSGWNVGELTPEAIKKVVPIAWNSNETQPTAKGTHSVAIGNNAQAIGGSSTALGAHSIAGKMASLAVGHLALAMSASSISIGNGTSSERPYSLIIGDNAKIYTVGSSEESGSCSIVIGSFFYEYVDGTQVGHQCYTQGTGSITIGAGAKTVSRKAEDGTKIDSSNSVTIGCKAENKGADSVVIGASATGALQQSVVIGAAAKGKDKRTVTIGDNSVGGGEGTVVIGTNAGAHSLLNANNVIIGNSANAHGEGSISIGTLTSGIEANYSTALGYGSSVKFGYCQAFGAYARVSDYGATVIRSTAEDGTYTQLYFSGANTPLANTYENGEAMMGYVVRDKNNNVMVDAEGNAMVGTQKLSVLFPNNRGENAFTPAMLGLDDEWTPKPMFRPSDLDLPIEEPTEPEEYQPLPVYPIVEPEIEEI